MTKARELADLLTTAGGIDTTELADDAVTAAKLDDSASFTVNGLTVDGEARINTTSGKLTFVNDVAGWTQRMDAGDSSLYISSGVASPVKRIKAGNNGDITMFKDDGSTAGLTFDASSGNVDISGNLTLGGNLDMQDGDEIKLGAGDDLRLYHDGSNSIIQDVGTGNLIIEGTNLILRAEDNTQYLTATDNAEVSLYYNNTARFKTNSTGSESLGRLKVLGTDGGHSGSINLDNGGTNGSNWTIASTSDQYSIGEDKLIFNTGSAGNTSTTKMYLNENGQMVLGNTADTDLSSASLKLLLGSPLDASSSAIAQFDGFLRIKDDIWFHDGANTDDAIRLGYDSTLDALRVDAFENGGTNTLAADIIRATKITSGSNGSSIDLVPVSGSDTSPFIRFYDFSTGGGSAATVDDNNWAIGADDTNVSSFKIVYGGAAGSNKITSIHGTSAAFEIDSNQITKFKRAVTAETREAKGAVNASGSTLTSVVTETNLAVGTYLVHAWIQSKGTANDGDIDPVDVRIVKAGSLICTGRINENDSSVAGNGGSSTGLEDFASVTALLNVNGSETVNVQVGKTTEGDSGGCNVNYKVLIYKLG